MQKLWQPKMLMRESCIPMDTKWRHIMATTVDLILRCLRIPATRHTRHALNVEWTLITRMVQLEL
eukprot:8630381-Ditylum_brightwellii.AAC.1